METFIFAMKMYDLVLTFTQVKIIKVAVNTIYIGICRMFENPKWPPNTKVREEFLLWHEHYITNLWLIHPCIAPKTIKLDFVEHKRFQRLLA